MYHLFTELGLLFQRVICVSVNSFVAVKNFFIIMSFHTLNYSKNLFNTIVNSRQGEHG